MSDTRWTNEQSDAITARNCNLLVAAAAGSGKTAVLVERIIKKITDEHNPVDIDRLLIVTFTNAAATEMRERIADAVSKVLEKNPESRLIQRQMALLGKASITTIHSFCIEVIRGNFHIIDIDPNFRIADETESTLMKLEALNDLFEEQYEKEDNQEFVRLLESYGSNRDDQVLMDMVLDLYSFIQSSPWPQVWLKAMTEAFKVDEGCDLADTIWGRVLIKAAKMELEGMKDMLSRAVEIIKTALGIEKYLPMYQEDLSNINDILSIFQQSETYSSVWDRVFEGLNAMGFSTLSRAAKEVDKEKQDEVKKIRDDVKARIRKLKESTIPACSDELINDLRELYPPMKCLSDLASELSSRYSQKKKNKSVMDFNDLEHYCLEILTQRDEKGVIKPSATAIAYRDRFDEIMVDEYQDSNLVQEIIINMISRVDENKPNVFMVGDVKQSIYKFRQARPELFMEKYNTYSEEKDNPFRKILLYKNFRSRKTVVDAVNFVFRQIMSVNAGELDYSEKEALNPGAIYAEIEQDDVVLGGSTELMLIQTNSISDDVDDFLPSEEESNPINKDVEDEILDNIQCEARMVAQKIKMLMNPNKDGKSFMVFDKGRKEYRRVEFRDIVILLRTIKNWSDVFVEELTLSGVPVFADTGGGFFKTIELEVVLSLLQIIDNPYQDIPLLSVLRSPMFSFNTDDLTDLRLGNPKGSLYEGLVKLADAGNMDINKKAQGFLEKLANWRETSCYLPTEQLIWRLYNDTGYYAMVGAMPGGEQRQANLRILFERAKQFEETSYKGLFNFINFIDKLKSSRGDMGSAKILSENDNVVRIMSIHKSKGLEFPIVFLSGCGKRFNLQDMNKSILLHQDLGFGPDVVDLKKRLSWPSVAKEAIKEKIRGETLSEEMRILYVALTRAREKLIITGSVNDASKAIKKWISITSTDNNKLPDYEILKGRNYLDWICPSVLRHKNCDGLRRIAPIGCEVSGSLIDDPSIWHIELWNKDDVLENKEEDKNQDREFINWLENIASNNDSSLNESPETRREVRAEINRRLSWEYKFKEAALVPAKMSVTELKRRFNSQDHEESTSLPGLTAPIVKKPLFLEERKGISAAEKGTVIHFIMQSLDFDSLKAIIKNKSLEQELSFNTTITSHIQEMVKKDLLTQIQADSVDIRMINGFLNSLLARRMLISDKTNREIPFNMQIPIEELFKDKNEESLQGETVLLQGVIDCYFEEEGELVLIDYKSDYVPAGKEHTIKERYLLQLDYYKKALEMLTGKSVKERYIYLFRGGKAIKI